MALQVKKFLTAFVADETKIKLNNNAALVARNAANSADVSLFKLNASDKMEFSFVPQVTVDPSGANDLVRKSYADALVASSATIIKQAVDVIATSNITLVAEQTIDGVLTSGSRVLLTGQTLPANNGIYVSGSGAWSRAVDADTSPEVITGMEVSVLSGAALGFTKWFLTTSGAIVLGTTALVFRQQNEWNREIITLVGGDITNQYVTLAFKGDPNTIDFFVDGGGAQRFTGDFTHSVVTGVSRLTFAGDIATGGPAALIAGDIVRVKYIKRS